MKYLIHITILIVSLLSEMNANAQDIVVFGVRNSAIVYSINKNGFSKSKDNGEHWEHIFDDLREVAGISDSQNVFFSDIQIASDNVLYLSLWGDLKEPGLYQSLDGGKHWKRIRVDLIDGLSIIDAQTLFVMVYTYLDSSSDKQSTYFTNDTGNSWIEFTTPALNDYYDNLFATDVNTIYISKSKSLYKSTDGGYHWVLLKEFDDKIIEITGIIGNEKVLSVLTKNGKLWLTNDFGLDWNKVSTLSFTSDVVGKNIHFENTQTIYAISNYQLYKSIDSGKTWKKIHIITKRSNLIESIHVMNDNTLCVGAMYGNLLKSTDGGKSWHDLTTLRNKVTIELSQDKTYFGKLIKRVLPVALV